MRAGSFPIRATRGDDDIVAIGADLEPGTLLAAYRRGLFPMRVGPARSRGGRPIRAGSSRSTASTCSRVAAARRSRASRSVSTPRSTTVMRGVRRPAPSARLDRRVVRRRVHAAARAGLGAQRRGVARRRARRRPLRRAHRRALRGGVDVPPRDRRVEGRVLGDGRAACGSTARRCSTCSGRRRTCASLGAVDVGRAEYLRRLLASAVA